MISYTIITQEQYTKLVEENEKCLIDKELLEKDNNNMKKEIKMLKNWLKLLRDQFKTEKSQTAQLEIQLKKEEEKVSKISNELNESVEIINELKNRLNETAQNMEKLEELKIEQKELTFLLSEQLSQLQNEIKIKNEENLKSIENRKSLEYTITELNFKIKRIEEEKEFMCQELKLNLEKINEVNLMLNEKTDLLEKLTLEYELCKSEKQKADAEIESYNKSPIPKLEEMLKAKEAWITELTKTISELRQKCIALEMKEKPHQQQFLSKGVLMNVSINSDNKQPAPNIVIPYQLPTNTQQVQSVPISTTQPEVSLMQQQRFKQEELERIKYLAICRELAKEFKSKLIKIQHEKKSVEEKYQSIKLKLNEYQYNEFRYKDQINSYIEKVDKFKKLTEKQQLEMERFIEEFDKELNNILKKKEHEVRMKFEEEIEKELRKRLKEDEDLILKKSDTSSSESNESSLSEKEKYFVNDDYVDLELLKLELGEAKVELKEKEQENYKLKAENKKIQKDLEKLKLSKESYKKKFLEIEEECYEKSTELRRYKTIVQELCHELEIKANELYIVKNEWIKKNNPSAGSSSSQNNNHNEDAYDSLSGKLSSDNNQRKSLKRENSEHFEYQVSEIDTEGQRKNENFLNNLIIGKFGSYNNIFRREFTENMSAVEPALPSKKSKKSDHEVDFKESPKKRTSKNPAVNESIDSINNGDISSELESSQSISQKTNNSPNSSSISSKNSYQSYGIKYLYAEKLKENGKKFLFHKNSLQ